MKDKLCWEIILQYIFCRNKLVIILIINFPQISDIHAVADMGLPNKICQQKKTFRHCELPNWAKSRIILCILSHYALHNKSEEDPKAMGLLRMEVCIFLIPAVRKLRLPSYTAYLELVYKFFPSFHRVHSWLGLAFLCFCVLFCGLSSSGCLQVFCK